MSIRIGHRNIPLDREELNLISQYLTRIPPEIMQLTNLKIAFRSKSINRYTC